MWAFMCIPMEWPYSKYTRNFTTILRNYVDEKINGKITYKMLKNQLDEKINPKLKKYTEE